MTETQPVTKHLQGFACATVTLNNHAWSKIPHCSAPMSLIELCFAEKRLLWKRQMIYTLRPALAAQPKLCQYPVPLGESWVTLCGKSRAELVPAWKRSTTSADLGNSVTTARAPADHQRGTRKHHPSSAYPFTHKNISLPSSVKHIRGWTLIQTRRASLESWTRAISPSDPHALGSTVAPGNSGLKRNFQE